MKKDFGSVLDNVAKKVHQERATHETESQKPMAQKQAQEETCPQCQAPNMIPMNTPRGQKLIKELHSE